MPQNTFLATPTMMNWPLRIVRRSVFATSCSTRRAHNSSRQRRWSVSPGTRSASRCSSCDHATRTRGNRRSSRSRRPFPSCFRPQRSTTARHWRSIRAPIDEQSIALYILFSIRASSPASAVESKSTQEPCLVSAIRYPEARYALFFLWESHLYGSVVLTSSHEKCETRK